MFEFTPAQRADARRRHAAIALVLLIWPVSLAIVVWQAATDDMILIALGITGGVFLIALAWLGWSAWLTARRDRPEHPGTGSDPA